MTKFQQTQIDSFNQILTQLPGRKEQVLWLLEKHGPTSLNGLARFLNTLPSNITAAVNSLVRDGLIAYNGQTITDPETGNSQTLLQLHGGPINLDDQLEPKLSKSEIITQLALENDYLREENYELQAKVARLVKMLKEK